MPRHKSPPPLLQPVDIRNLRLDARLTQQQLAQKLGYSLELIASWELGRRRITDDACQSLLVIVMDIQCRRMDAMLALRGFLYPPIA